MSLRSTVRERGIIVSQAVLIAIGIDWDGRRQVLAVESGSRSQPRQFVVTGAPRVRG